MRTEVQPVRVSRVQQQATDSNKYLIERVESTQNNVDASGRFSGMVIESARDYMGFDPGTSAPGPRCTYLETSPLGNLGLFSFAPRFLQGARRTPIIAVVSHVAGQSRPDSSTDGYGLHVSRCYRGLGRCYRLSHLRRRCQRTD